MRATAKVLIASVLVGFVASRATGWLRELALFRVERLVVHGTERLSTGEVLALVSDLRGQHIVFVDLDAWRRKLLSSPWVAEAALHRVLPSTIEIWVRERRPVGLARLGTRLFLVDAAGVVIDEFGPQYRQFDLPVIDGLAPGSPRGPAAIDPVRAALASRVIAALEAHRELGTRVSQIDVGDVRDVAVLLEGEPAWLHLGTEQFTERLQTYLDLLPVLSERVPDRESVDLRFGERVYVRPAQRWPNGGVASLDRAVPNRPF